MKYYTDIQENEDGSVTVSEENRVLGIHNMAIYRTNIPGDADYDEQLGPYAVEEKIGRTWIKIGMLSQKQRHSNNRRTKVPVRQIVKKKPMPKPRTNYRQITHELIQQQETHSKNEMVTVSQMIYEHLGGKDFMIKIGAKKMIKGVSTLAFKIRKNPNKINYINVILNELHQYDIEFLKVDNYEVVTLNELYNIHPDNLLKSISEETGIMV